MDDFVIVSLGITSGNEKINPLSLEAKNLLKKCNGIVTINSEIVTSELQKLNNNIIDLRKMFMKKLMNGENAHQIIAKRYAQLCAKRKNIVFVTAGNAFVGEGIAYYIIDYANKLCKNVKIISGQSFLDKFFVHLRFDPLKEGLLIILPNHLEQTLKIDMPMVICLIGYSKYGSYGNYCSKKENIVLEELINIKKQLLKKFPPNHKIFLVNSKVIPAELDKIEYFLKFWEFGESTIYVPTIHY